MARKARIEMVAGDHETPSEQIVTASGFLKGFFSGTAAQRSRRLPRAPLGAIQTAALHDPDPFARRACLFFLDHYANDESLETFGEALGDPADFVRNMALHGLACESCKVGELDRDPVVPGLVRVVESDPSVELRTKAVPLLWRFAGSDDRARSSLELVATAEPDAILRQAASDALAGRFVAPRKRYERAQRRHAKTARRPGVAARHVG